MAPNQYMQSTRVFYETPCLFIYLSAYIFTINTIWIWVNVIEPFEMCIGKRLMVQNNINSQEILIE